MSSGRAGGGSASAAIPAKARTAVQTVKDVVSNTSDDEIYAMLKDCNMDANEAVQRLLTQDVFQEVRRKRDKKKELNKEAPENRSRPSNGGPQSRGGRSGSSDRGSGRGNSLPRHNSADLSGGRGKPFVARENGNVYPNVRGATASGIPAASSTHGQPKGIVPGYSSATSSSPAAAAATSSSSPGLPNGSSLYSRSSSAPHASWGASSSGHATMADIVKANGAPQPVIPPVSASMAATPPAPATSPVQQFVAPSPAPVPSVSSGVYSSSTDPVLHPSLDSRSTGNAGTIKREVGTVGNQRPKADRTISLIVDSALASPSPPQPVKSPPVTASSSLETDAQVPRPNSPPAPVTPPTPQERSASHTAVSDTESLVVGQPRQTSGTGASSGTPGSRALVGGQLSSRPVYQSQQQPVGTQKVSATGLEWKPKPAVSGSVALGTVGNTTSSEAVRSPPAAVTAETGLLAAASNKLQSINLHDDQSVIIPNHLQVPESERPCLSFGSFTPGFGTSFVVSDDINSSALSTADSVSAVEMPVEQSSTSSVATTAAVALSPTFVLQPISAPEEKMVSNIEATVVSTPAPAVSQPEIIKPDPVVQQNPHYPYLPTVPNYPGFNLMPPIPAQYTYEPTDSQPQDVSRLPNLMPYTDPAPSYYTPGFRPGSDGDSRYPAFMTSNPANKYNGNMGLINMTGQNLPSSQESGNSMLTSSVPSVQTSQTVNAQAVPTMPQQQPLPMHPYAGQPAGAPLGHHYTNVFGYQYMPPSYAYMHTHAPYQHNYTTNSGYPQQPPAGSSYPSAAGSTYPPGGAATVKYQLPQYKPANAAGNSPHSAAAAAYGGYTTTAPGYGANPSVTAGSATGYDEVGAPQYKDSNLYIPSQPAEGSTVWIQTQQLSRDMAAAGMQASSYYNLPGQGQHTAYGHTQQPTHTHAHPGAYASLYHPPQTGPAPSAHQLLQQPQTLGAGGAGSSQAGGYQQPQRAQQTWTNNY